MLARREYESSDRSGQGEPTGCGCAVPHSLTARISTAPKSYVESSILLQPNLSDPWTLRWISAGIPSRYFCIIVPSSHFQCPRYPIGSPVPPPLLHLPYHTRTT